MTLGKHGSKQLEGRLLLEEPHKNVRCDAFNMLTSKNDWRHSCVHFCKAQRPSAPSMAVLNTFDFKMWSGYSHVRFLEAHLPRWLRTGRFIKLSFRLSGTTKRKKNRYVSRLFHLARATPSSVAIHWPCLFGFFSLTLPFTVLHASTRWKFDF